MEDNETAGLNVVSCCGWLGRRNNDIWEYIVLLLQNLECGFPSGLSHDLSPFRFCRGPPRLFGEFSLFGALPESVNLFIGDEQFAFDIYGFDHVHFAPTVPRWSGFADPC